MAEWEILLPAIAAELQISNGGDRARKQATDHCHDVCGECHEEVLSEPVYFPSVMNSLKMHFNGKSRVEKILLLARVIKLGTEALDREE